MKVSQKVSNCAASCKYVGRHIFYCVSFQFHYVTRHTHRQSYNDTDYYRPLYVGGSRDQSERSAYNGISFGLAVSTKHMHEQ